MMLQTSDDAFAIDPEDQIVLRVLSGVQLGAEMSLMPAEYLIGSGDEADIILADAALKWKHAGITVDSEGASIEAIEGSVSIGSERLEPGKRRQLEMPATLVIGMLIIGIGKQTTDWSQVELPDVRDTADERPSSEDEDEDDAEEDDSEDDSDGEATEEEAEATEEEAPEVEAAPKPETAPEDKSKNRTAAIVGTTLAVVLLLGLGGFGIYQSGLLGGSGSDSDGTTEVVLTPEQRVVEVVSNLGFQDVEVGDPFGLGLTISGYVSSYDDHRALMKALEEQGLQPLDRVRIVERMLDTIAVTLASVNWPEPNYERHLVVTHEGDGRVVIDGYLGPEVDRSSLRRRLESDVPGISFLRFTRSDLRSWRSILIDMIEDAKLSDWLTTSPDGAKIRVDGELTARQAKIWQQVGERFTEESRGRPRISIGVTALPAWERIESEETEVVEQPVERSSSGEFQLPAAPTSVLERFDAQPVVAPAPEAPVVKIIPRPNFVVIGIILSDDGDSIALLSNGASIRTGDRFDGGAVVTEVLSDRVTVEAGENKYTYHVRRR